MKAYPPWMREHLDAEWQHIRQRGRSRFVWRDYVLPYGIIATVTGIGWGMFVTGSSLGDLFSRRGAYLFYIALLVTGVATYVGGRREWNARERSFSQRFGRESRKSGEDGTPQ